MSSLQLCYGCSYVSRCTLYEDVLQLYKSGDILSKYPCRFKFKEEAIDTGGVGRDLFSAFYDEVYRNFFEGSSFVTPAVHPGINMDNAAVIGTIISHSYLVTAYFLYILPSHALLLFCFTSFMMVLFRTTYWLSYLLLLSFIMMH